MKYIVLLFLLFLLLIGFQFCNAQDVTNTVLIEFKDKGKITLNEKSDIDLPISEQYIQHLETKGLHLKNSSNWLNIGVFTYTNADVLIDLNKLNFIKKVSHECVPASLKTPNKFLIEEQISNQNTNQRITETHDNDDIQAFYLPQITQVKGDYLQDLGYKGNGLKMAVIDAGFPNAKTLGAMQHIYQSNRLLGTYDYALNDSNVYAYNAHGTYTFSIIGGLKDNFSGAAPDASFYLFRTEVDASEGQLEELYLTSALERCVELGVKVVSISLGYTNGFNDGTQNHTWNDMNGYTTIAAKAANIAASKGILVCASAGNDGNASWKYIGTPADADSAFTIGAVDINGNPSTFTSYNFDTATRVKPNVAGLGSGTSFINLSNAVSTGNGTSYSCPLIAGLSACLWQAFPAKTNWEIKTAIEQSAHLYLSPSKRLGYGIPNFKTAYELLANPTFVSNKNLEKDISIYPNPAINDFYIQNKSNQKIQTIEIFNQVGQVVYQHKNNMESTQQISIADFTNGMYTVKLQFTNGDIIIKKIIKQ